MATNVTDTPDGFTLAAPWPSVNKALLIELRCFLTSVRNKTNVLSASISASSKNSIVLDQTFVLPVVASNLEPSAFEYVAAAKNVATVVSSNRPVRVILTTENGSLDLGTNTVFIVTSPIVSIRFVNDENKGDAQVNLIVV